MLTIPLLFAGQEKHQSACRVSQKPRKGGGRMRFTSSKTPLCQPERPLDRSTGSYHSDQSGFHPCRCQTQGLPRKELKEVYRGNL